MLASNTPQRLSVQPVEPVAVGTGHAGQLREETFGFV
jgi:hypothetical protein